MLALHPVKGLDVGDKLPSMLHAATDRRTQFDMGIVTNMVDLEERSVLDCSILNFLQLTFGLNVAKDISKSRPLVSAFCQTSRFSLQLPSVWRRNSSATPMRRRSTREELVVAVVSLGMSTIRVAAGYRGEDPNFVGQRLEIVHLYSS